WITAQRDRRAVSRGRTGFPPGAAAFLSPRRRSAKFLSLPREIRRALEVDRADGRREQISPVGNAASDTRIQGRPQSRGPSEMEAARRSRRACHIGRCAEPTGRPPQAEQLSPLRPRLPSGGASTEAEK